MGFSLLGMESKEFDIDFSYHYEMESNAWPEVQYTVVLVQWTTNTNKWKYAHDVKSIGELI